MDGESRDARVEGLLTGRYKWITLGGVLLIIASGFEIVAVSVTMPTIVRDLNSLSWYSAGFSATIAVSILGIVLAGPWGDQRGPRAPLYVGVVSCVVGLILAGSAHTMPFFLIGRAIQGLGIGLINVSVYVIVGRELPKHLHSKMFSLTAVAWLLPALLGPIVAGLLVDTVGWRWAFWGVVPIMVVGSVILYPGFATEGGAAAQSMPMKEWRGRMLRAVVIACAVGAIQPVGETVKEGYLPWAIGGVIVLLGLILAASRQLLPPHALRLGAGLPALIDSRLFLAGTYFAFEVYIPLIGQTFRGLSPTKAGLVVASGAITWAIASALQTRISEGMSRSKYLTGGMILVILGLLGAITLVQPSIPLIIPVLSWAVAGFGIGVAYPLASVMMLAMSAPERIGWNSSALSMSEQIGTSTSLALGGVLFGALVGQGMLTAILAYCAVPLLYGVLGVVAASRSKPETAVND